MKAKTIRYRFRMPDNTREDFIFKLNPKNLELQNNIPHSLPKWAKLDFHQCSNCQLDVVTYPYCPLASNIVSIIRRFDGILSYEKVKVVVITEERWITQETTAQNGISSMLGLVIATCGCPHTTFFKPMAWFHLPLASEEETILRATSIYLLAQYYKHKEGGSADFKFEGLSKIYNNMQIVNLAIAKRLREAVVTDSSLNALVQLDNFAQTLPFVIEESLEEIRYLFSPFLSKCFNGRNA